MSSNNVLITVVTVVYNVAALLEETLESVFEQDYLNVQYIIIDGGSTDGTVEIIKKYEPKLHYWVSEPDKGIYDAMNKGIKIASGDVIGLLNAGDKYLPGVFNKLANYYDKQKKHCVYFGNVIFAYEDLNIKLNVNAVLDRLPYAMSICHQAMFVTKQTYDSYGLYNIEYRYSADYDYTLNLYINKVPFINLQLPVASYLTGGSSDGNIISSRWERIKVQKSRGVAKPRAVFLSIKEIMYYLFYQLSIKLGKNIAKRFWTRRLLKSYSK